MQLIIVESPSKAKTIEKYLKGKYKVDASEGHIRDLPKHTFGIKIDNQSFIPEYKIDASHEQVVKELKKLAKGDTSYVTLIHGADVTEENAESMQQLISSKLSDKIEVMLVNGGQPVYYYIISVE